MNSLILISPSLVRGFQPILSGKFKTGGRNLSLLVMYARSIVFVYNLDTDEGSSIKP